MHSHTAYAQIRYIYWVGLTPNAVKGSCSAAKEYVAIRRQPLECVSELFWVSRPFKCRCSLYFLRMPLVLSLALSQFKLPGNIRHLPCCYRLV